MSIYNTVMKILFTSMTMYIVYILKMKLYSIHEYVDDYFTVKYLILCCIIASSIKMYYENIKEYGSDLLFIFECSWTFSICLEAVTIIPQLFLLQKKGSIENLTSHYMAFLGFYKILYIMNWIYRLRLDGHNTQIIVWIGGIFQSVLYADFFYLYYKSKQKNLCAQVTLPDV